MSETASILELIKQLEDTNLLKRIQIKRQILAFGQQAVDPLIDAMHHQTRYRNWEAASLLGQIGDVRSVEPLLEALVSNNPILAQVAAEALGAFELNPYRHEIINALFSSHPVVQPLIVILLEKISDDMVLSVLIELLVETPVASVRLAIIQTLGNLGNPLATNVLRAFARDPDAHVRKRVESALKKLGTC